jgi:hypothetical protein
MNSKAFQHLYDLSTEIALVEFLKTYQFDAEDDFCFIPDMGFATQTEAITQFILYICRKEYVPNSQYSNASKAYVRFDYDRLRDDVLELIEKLSDREWGWIDDILSNLESEGIQPEFTTLDPDHSLPEREEFRNNINRLIRAFRDVS